MRFRPSELSLVTGLAKMVCVELSASDLRCTHNPSGATKAGRRGGLTISMFWLICRLPHSKLVCGPMWRSQTAISCQSLVVCGNLRSVRHAALKRDWIERCGPSTLRSLNRSLFGEPQRRKRLPQWRKILDLSHWLARQSCAPQCPTPEGFQTNGELHRRCVKSWPDNLTNDETHQYALAQQEPLGAVIADNIAADVESFRVRSVSFAKGFAAH